MFIIPLHHNKEPDYRVILILNAVIYIQRPVLIFNFITIYKAITLECVPGYILIYPSYTLKLRIPPLFHYHIYDIDAPPRV